MDLCAWHETRGQASGDAGTHTRPAPARARPQKAQWSDPGAYVRFVNGMRQNGSTEKGIAWLLSSDP